jgi:hypothetical protein
MELKHRLVDKVKIFCEKNEIHPLPNSITYLGLNPSVEMSNGTRMPFHIVGYSTGGLNMIVRNYIHIDPESEKLVLLITPHLSESIDEDY